MSKEINIKIYETLKGPSLRQTPGSPPENLFEFWAKPKKISHGKNNTSEFRLRF